MDKSTFKDTNITSMPDEILHRILQFLNIKEALRTSVLSRRWRYAWSCRRVLDFQALQPRNDAQLMNHVAASHRGAIDEFRVPTSSHDIDNWIRFAIQKRVQRLHLYGPFYKNQRANLQLQPDDVLNFRLLRSLCLEFINISGELLECFLLECKLLERLVVVSSRTLIKLKISGQEQQLKLKHLYILSCPCLKSVAIFANTPDLVTFSIRGLGIEYVHLENAPKVNGLRLTTQDNHQDVLTSPIFLRYVLQLHFLHFDCNCVNSTSFKGFPKFTSLKHLVMTFFCHHCWRLTHMIHLLSAAPVLSKLTLEIKCPCKEQFEDIKRQYWAAARANGAPSHQCLQVLEATDFIGTRECIELILYLFNNLTTLLKLVICHQHLSKRTPLEKMEDCADEEISWPVRRYYPQKESEVYQRTIEKASELKTMLPPGVEFVLVE